MFPLKVLVELYFLLLIVFGLIDGYAQSYTCSKQSNINSIIYQYCPIIDSQDRIESIGVELKNNTIIYRIIWHDEVYPNSFVNYIYRIYRKIKYGSEKDIEYIAVKIGKRKSSTYIIEFEYPQIHKLFFIDLFKHRKIRRIIDYNACRKIKLKVITWNHLFSSSIECFNSLNGDSVTEVPTFYINENFKRKYKIKNRSNPSL
jgi:hypothetical protein